VRGCASFTVVNCEGFKVVRPEREGDREERSVGAAAVAATVDAIAANANAMRGTTHERRVCDGALTY